MTCIYHTVAVLYLNLIFTFLTMQFDYYVLNTLAIETF